MAENKNISENNVTPENLSAEYVFYDTYLAKIDVRGRAYIPTEFINVMQRVWKTELLYAFVSPEDGGYLSVCTWEMASPFLEPNAKFSPFAVNKSAPRIVELKMDAKNRILLTAAAEQLKVDISKIEKVRYEGNVSNFLIRFEQPTKKEK